MAIVGRDVLGVQPYRAAGAEEKKENVLADGSRRHKRVRVMMALS